MDAFIITPAVLGDLAEMLPLGQECLGGFWSPEAYRSELLSDHSQVVVLRHRLGAMVGFGSVWFVCDEAHIVMLAIAPAYQMKGLGSALLWSLLSIARGRGAAWVVLEVEEKNCVALGLYQKFGFTVVGRRENYYPETGQAALVLWCKGMQTALFSRRLEELKTTIGAKLAQHHWTGDLLEELP